jgi:hypothetical protein
VSTRVKGASGLAACLFNLLAGCSGASGPATSQSPLLAGDATSSAGSTPSAVCGTQSVRSEDLAGILVAAITSTKPVSGDSQSCEYSTSSFPAIIVSVRPGLGKSTVESWIAGRMPLKAVPLTGIGDAAAWQDSLHEVIAQKHDILCDVQVRGGATDIALAVDALPAALGALCNRIFAAG